MAKFRDVDVRKVPVQDRRLLEMMKRPGPKHPVEDKEAVKAELLAEVAAAIDEKLATMTEGQGLGIVFRLEVLLPARSKAWADAVKQRDGYACAECGSRQGIAAHHEQSVADFPELMDDIDNGVTLCADCHAEKHPAIKPLMLSKSTTDGKAD